MKNEKGDYPKIVVKKNHGDNYINDCGTKYGDAVNVYNEHNYAGWCSDGYYDVYNLDREELKSAKKAPSKRKEIDRSDEVTSSKRKAPDVQYRCPKNDISDSDEDLDDVEKVDNVCIYS